MTESNELRPEGCELSPELLKSAAAPIIAAATAEFDSDGRRYSSQEEIDAVIERLRSVGEWPEQEGDGPVIGRRLMNKRRGALWAEGIVTRPFWL